MWLSSISHTVGTPAVCVTFSASRSSKTEAPSSLAPGSTNLVPIEGAENAMPQLLAWNSGTTGSMVSPAPAPSESPVLAISACMTLERCEYSTPFGSPVVPEGVPLRRRGFFVEGFPFEIAVDFGDPVLIGDRVLQRCL